MLESVLIFGQKHKPDNRGYNISSKSEGLLTILFFSFVLILFLYSRERYLEDQYVSNIVSLNSAITNTQTLASLYCGASYKCIIEQEEQCVPERILLPGDNTTITSSDCKWTITAFTKPSEEKIPGSTIALYIDSPEKKGEKILQPVVHVSSYDVEMYLHMTTTIDDHGTSLEHETWYVVPLIPLNEDFNPCKTYRKDPKLQSYICVSLKVFINTNTYKVYYDSDTAMVNTVTMFVSLVLALYVLFKVCLKAQVGIAEYISDMEKKNKNIKPPKISK